MLLKVQGSNNSVGTRASGSLSGISLSPSPCLSVWLLICLFLMTSPSSSPSHSLSLFLFLLSSLSFFACPYVPSLALVLSLCVRIPLPSFFPASTYPLLSLSQQNVPGRGRPPVERQSLPQTRVGVG